MKLAFSNTACPDWDLPTLLAKAKDYGYEGLELHGLPQRSSLTAAPELTANPAETAKLAADAGVRLLCLATTATLSSPDARVLAENQALVREHVKLAAALDCPFVRVLPGDLAKACPFGYERRDTVMARIGRALRELAAFAAEHSVTIVVENAGEYSDSQAMWYFVDAADSTAVRAYWNPLAARACQERPSLSIPRLNYRVALVRVGDARFSDRGRVTESKPLGEGDAEVRHLVQLLKGMAYDGFLVVDWPKATMPELAAALPAAAKYLQQLIAEQPVPLTAYKGDKFKPRQGHEFVKA